MAKLRETSVQNSLTVLSSNSDNKSTTEISNNSVKTNATETGTLNVTGETINFNSENQYMQMTSDNIDIANIEDKPYTARVSIYPNSSDTSSGYLLFSSFSSYYINNISLRIDGGFYFSENLDNYNGGTTSKTNNIIIEIYNKTTDKAICRYNITETIFINTFEATSGPGLATVRVSYSDLKKISSIEPPLEKISFGSVGNGSNIGYRFFDENEDYTTFYYLGTEVVNGITKKKGLNIAISFECQEYKNNISIGSGNTTGANSRNNISLGNNISSSETCKNTVSIGNGNTVGANSTSNILLGNNISIPNESENSVYIGNNINLNKSYPLDIAAGGNHLKMDSGGALSFGKVILDSPISSINFTLADDELGLFIINFSIIDNDVADQYTTILSRVARTGGADNIIFDTFTADSGGYRLKCTGAGDFFIYDSSGILKSGCYLKKIIKIMSY